MTGPQVSHRASKVDSKKLPRQRGGRKRRISEPGSGDTFVIDLDTGSEPGSFSMDSLPLIRRLVPHPANQIATELLSSHFIFCIAPKVPSSTEQEFADSTALC